MDSPTFTALVSTAVSITGSVGVSWLQARSQRKVRLKTGDFEVEAPNVSEAKELMASMQALLLPKEKRKPDEP